ncbi:MAG TPA: glycosyltransferase family 2 protein [Thermoplasmatales archaeon]|nr:MAG: glycosyltransferase family 2 protein [Deltaproteobacteria bacterium]HHF55654.1 glycosyltransferase family 2 protein [Thermoplasmatales archaeon]
MKVSILLPTLNEEEGIGVTIDSIKKEEFEKRGWELEIVIVDGNSTDRTREIAKEKGAKIIIEPRKGYGRAYKTGLAKVDGDIIVTGDADGTYPFDKAHEYVDLLLKENLDFITTNRFAELKHGAMSFKHFVGNFILSFTLRLLYGIKLKDSQSGMWIIRREALKKIKPLEEFHDGMPFSEEIKIEMFKKAKAKEIPSCLYRRKGVAKIQSWGDGWRNLKFLIKYRFSS